MLNLLTPLLAFTISVFSALASGAYCAEQKIIEHELSSTEFEELRLNALAGELYIEAQDTDQISVRGVACADRKIYLDKMDITLDPRGSILEITAVIPYHERSWHADYAHIDLTLTVPKGLMHLIKDSSGDFEASGISLSMLNDSSGDIRLRNTLGDVSITDSAGFISVRGHTGNIEVEDSSGDLDLADIDGDLRIVRDSSGDIDIESVTGMVAVDRDSSGDIEIESVGRNVTVGADGSGSIKIRDVQGSVEIGSDGSGNVTVQMVDGDFVLSRKGSGDIRTAKIQGDISIPEF